NTELGAFIDADPGANILGDFDFDGNLRKWQQAINAYTIRMLASLSKKADDTELDVKGRFANIVSNPGRYPLMGSIADNMQITHRDEEGFRGNYNPNQGVYRASVVLADTYIDLLKQYQDPRLPRVADPTPNALAANPGNEAAVRADFSSYAGADVSASGATNVARKLDGNLSFPNEARYWNFVGQPSILIGYAEQELHIAEAAHLGWITADAKTHYDNGVSASMAFYGVDAGEATEYLANHAPY